MGSITKSIGSMLGVGSDSAYGRNLDTIQGQQRELAQMSIDQLKGLNPQQTQFGQQLAQGALGQGPSLVQAQLQQVMDRNLQQQIAAAKSNRAVNPALAARNVANNAANVTRDLGATGAVAKIQEQQQQQGMFANYLNQLQGGVNGSLNSAAAINQNMQQNNQQLVGGLLSTAGTLGAAYLTGGATKGLPKLGGGGAQDGGMSRGMGERAMAFSEGGKVPGKAPVKGDSPKNDIVDAKLSPGEVVVPRTVVAKGPEAVSNFVKALQDSKKSSSPAPQDVPAGGFAAILAAQKEMNERLKALEAKKKKD